MLLSLVLTLFQETAKPEEPPAFGPLEIGIAAEVLGLHFSEKELELMLPDVLERSKQLERLRAVPLSNDVAPALFFAPDPRELRSDRTPSSVVLEAEAVIRPAALEDLAFAGIAQLSSLLRTRSVTCVELAHMYLGRLRRLDEKLHCVVTLTEERALARARAMDAELAAGRWRGPLHGVPWVAKDLLAVKGYPTTWGTPPYRDQSFEYDAAVVEKLDAAGAVLIAKVSLGELAWGDVWFGGQTRNPWSLEEGSSGSSAGSSAAVTAGCAAFAIGSETYGSIVSPSHACGASSLRPTFGRVSRYGAMALCWSLDKLGPICRSGQDAALVFDELIGADPRDPGTVTLPFDTNWKDSGRGWKVGYSPQHFEGAEGQRCRHVLEELKRLGMELVPLELPAYPVDEMMIVLAAEAGAAFDDFSRGEQDDTMVRQERQAWPNVFRHAQLIPAVDYIRANRLRTSLISAYEARLSTVAAFVHPSYAGRILAATNLSGHPTFVAPCGFAEDGKPFSISFTGKLFGEDSLMSVAMAWQRSTDYHRRHPSL